MLNNGSILPLKILVKEIKPPEKKGNILIAPSTKSLFPTIAGEIILIGTLVGNFKDLTLTIGDKVLFSPNCFVRVTIEDKEYLLLNIQDVLYIWK